MQNYITKEGLEKLKKELEYLKTVKRKEITERLRRAIAFGDLSENFDYHNTREEQDFLEKRIAELEEKIAGSKVMSASGNSEVVHLGCTVLLENGRKKFSYTITDPHLANPSEQKLSAESPLGSALLGKKKGDTLSIDTPNGKTEYKIIDII